MEFTIEGIKSNVQKFKYSISVNDSHKLYELLSLSEKLYGNEIPAIIDCYEEASNYSGTLERNARIVVSLLEEYINSHSNICFSKLECDDEELNKLISDSMEFYNKNELALATEKVWDAFERLKTYYSPQLNKSDSAKKNN